MNVSASFLEANFMGSNSLIWSFSLPKEILTMSVSYCMGVWGHTKGFKWQNETLKVSHSKLLTFCNYSLLFFIKHDNSDKTQNFNIKLLTKS